MHALRRREAVDSCRAILWAEKIPSTTDVASLNTFGRNEIEVAPISSALLRIACLVILYKTNSQPMALAAVSTPIVSRFLFMSLTQRPAGAPLC